ncbi:MAG: helix-turn-helix transcriptional regulator [Clostridia bacterium]|nr:helix-turn-helix transcriptional regulator [Clostridia bacterium]
MEIGKKIKRLRILCNLTQKELADRCELTKGYISQLENDLTSPSITTLVDILSALGTDINKFFNDEVQSKIVFDDSDFIEKISEESTLTWLVPNAQKNNMEPVMMELNPLSSTPRDMPHEGEEFGYVLSGEIEITLDKNRYVYKKGESFYYVADRLHYIKNNKQKTAKFIWISSPPNF